jgi:hypothetical protein
VIHSPVRSCTSTGAATTTNRRSSSPPHLCAGVRLGASVVGKDMPCNLEDSKDVQRTSPVRVCGGIVPTGLIKPISALFHLSVGPGIYFRDNFWTLLLWPKGAESIGPNLAH